MVKKVSLSIVLLVFVFLSGGCGTLVKGTTGLAQGLKDGAREDWFWLNETIKKSDGWVKDNLW